MKKEKLGITLIIIGIITIIIGICLIAYPNLEKINLQQELESYKGNVLDYSMIVDAQERELEVQEERYNKLFEANIKLYDKFESLLEKAASEGIDVSEYYDTAQSEDNTEEDNNGANEIITGKGEIIEDNDKLDNTAEVDKSKPTKVQEPAVSKEETNPDNILVRQYFLVINQTLR